MSAMSDMLGDILKKALPPEVMAMLTPENMQELGNRANAFITEMRSSLHSIEETQTLILKKLERLDNVRGNNSNAERPEPIGSINGHEYYQSDNG